MKRKGIVISVIVFLLTVLVCYGFTNSYQRCFYVGSGEDKQLYKALHIALPGYETIHYSEIVVPLERLVGTKYGDLRIVNDDGSENAEATAGLALQMLGLYSECKLMKQNGHWILYHPGKTERVFTMRAWYRIGRPVIVSD